MNCMFAFKDKNFLCFFHLLQTYWTYAIITHPQNCLHLKCIEHTQKLCILSTDFINPRRELIIMWIKCPPWDSYMLALITEDVTEKHIKAIFSFNPSRNRQTSLFLRIFRSALVCVHIFLNMKGHCYFFLNRKRIDYLW